VNESGSKWARSEELPGCVEVELIGAVEAVAPDWEGADVWTRGVVVHPATKSTETRVEVTRDNRRTFMMISRPARAFRCHPLVVGGFNGSTRERNSVILSWRTGHLAATARGKTLFGLPRRLLDRSEPDDPAVSARW
jgi:hypothetical protein